MRNATSPVVEPSHQARLQQFLKHVDPALLESLKRDEQRRRRKLILFTITGGLIMGSIIATLSFLLLANPAVPAKQADQALALTTEAWQLWQNGKFDTAAETFEKAVKLDPTNANAFNGLGWARFNSGDADAARDAFDKCLKLQKDHPAAVNGLGQIAFAKKDYATAEKLWSSAVDTAPAARISLARLDLLQGKFDEAARLLDSPAVPANDPSIKQLIAAAKAKSLPAELKAQIEPAAPGAEQTLRAWALLNQGKLNQARELFESALSKNPNDFAAHNGLGFAMINLGKPAEAKAHFEQALKSEPTAAGPTNGLAICLKAEGKTDEAIKLWEKVAAQPPTPNAGTTGLAMTYFEKKEYAKAMPYLEQLAKSAPEAPQFKEMLAEAKEATDKK